MSASQLSRATLRTAFVLVLLIAAALSPAFTPAVFAHDPDFTSDFNREDCTFATQGNNRYLPLWPGLSLTLEGMELDDEGELVEISAVNSVTYETEVIDGVRTRVQLEVESEEGELVEISRNFLAICRETGDVWYFGEDVDDYEDGVIVGHEGAWRAGVAGAQAGVLMPGSPMAGARYFQEIAPGIAEDQGEVIATGVSITVPAGTFTDAIETQDTSALNPDDSNEKFFVAGLGGVKDDELELVSFTPPPCLPDATTHCLNDGRFKVDVEWETVMDDGDGQAILPTGLSGEFWFFNPENTELLVKVIDACDNATFNSFWVFAAGLTNVGVTLTVTDTATGQVNTYTNPRGTDYAPVLDTDAFMTCDVTPM